MPLQSDEDIAHVLRCCRRIALVGASAKAERPSHRVMRFLLGEGYQVYPVNPGMAGQRLLGCEVYAQLTDLPGPVDMVDVFRQPRFLEEVVQQSISIGARAVWTQLGVVDADAIASAEAAGLDVVADRCPAIEIPRLAAPDLALLSSPVHN